jgi:hypothetical protein
MCFFSHKFGEIKADGFQYCSKCGKAEKPSIPHPCVNGHIWVTTDEQRYKLTKYNGYGQSQEHIQMQYFQSCSRCGLKTQQTVG